MKNLNDNFSLNQENNNLIIKINKNIYSKEIITQTTYVLLDKYYFLIDEDDSGNYWEVLMKPKEKETKITEDDAMIFFDELLESSSYIDQLKRTEDIRQVILEKAILSQTIDEKFNEDLD